MSDWYIVGRGPSLLTVTAEEFGDGSVIALNRAIEQVRALHLPNPTYAMAKDGCVIGAPHGSLLPEGHDCLLDVRPPEILLVSQRESRNCLPDYPQRVVIDVEAMGLPWYFQSAPVAVKWALGQGATRFFMFAHDGYRNRDTRRVEGTELVDQQDSGYWEAGWRADNIGREAGAEVLWRPV